MFQGWKRLGAGRSNEDNVSARDPTDILDIFCENNCSTDQDLYLKFTLRRGNKMEIIVSPLFALDYLSNNNLSRIILLIIIVSKQSLAQSLYVNKFQFRFVLIIKKFVMV